MQKNFLNHFAATDNRQLKPYFEIVNKNLLFL